MRLRLLYLGFCLMTFSAIGQDIHWTQFQMAPLQLNPAQTGDFLGTARLSGIARTQGNSIANTGFFTYAFGIDVPVMRGFRKNDWIGVGLSFATDKAGQLEVGIQSQGFSGSYHFAVDKKARTYLTLGVQMESYGRKIGNTEAAEFRNPNTMVLDNGAMDFKNATGYGAGLQLTTTLNPRTKVRAGFKYTRIGKVDVSLASGSRYRTPNRITIHGNYERQVAPKAKLLAAALYENYGTASEVVIQGRGKLLLDEKKDLDFSAGLGYRLGDALQVLIGMGWGDIDIGFGYDLPVSSQSPEAIPLGGLELALTYVLKIYPEPKVDPVIFCPRF